MPIFQTRREGVTEWSKEERKPTFPIGLTDPEKRRMGTIKSTARAMSFGMPEDEFEEVLKTNATTAEMDIEELRELALEEFQRQDSEE